MSEIFKKSTPTGFETDGMGRIYYFDNLKFFLILLVVIAHFTYPATSINKIYEGLGMFLITVPMPVFIFVSGYFSKSIIETKTGRFKFERIIHFIILYTFMSFVLFLINYYLLKSVDTYHFLSPITPAWFLMSCMFWYALIPVIQGIKPVYVLTCSVILALIAGIDPLIGDFLTLSRVICFFPFFISGYYVSREVLESLLNFGRKYARIIALSGLIVFLIFCIMDPLNYGEFRRIISPHYPYEQIPALGDMYNLTGPLARFIWYTGSAVIVVAFLIVIPRKKILFTNIGTKTLQIYILHSVTENFLRYLGLYTFADSSNNWIINALPFITAICLTFLFSLKPFGLPFNFVTSLKFEFLFKGNKNDHINQ